jgi:hypothetical protein
MRTKLTLLALAVALAISPVAMADTFAYDFTTTLSNAFTNGVLTASGTEVTSGVYLITSGTLSLFSVGLGFDPPIATGNVVPIPVAGTPGDTFTSPSGYFYYDNLLTPGSVPSLDNSGLLFILSNGDEMNIYANGGSVSSALEYTLYESNGAQVNGNFNVINATTPDGGMTLMLLGGVLVGLETLRRKLRV